MMSCHRLSLAVSDPPAAAIFGPLLPRLVPSVFSLEFRFLQYHGDTLLQPVHGYFSARW